MHRKDSAADAPRVLRCWQVSLQAGGKTIAKPCHHHWKEQMLVQGFHHIWLRELCRCASVFRLHLPVWASLIVKILPTGRCGNLSFRLSVDCTGIVTSSRNWKPHQASNGKSCTLPILACAKVSMLNYSSAGTRGKRVGHFLTRVCDPCTKPAG